MDKAIRVLIADDHKLVRMGLQAMMNTKTELNVIGEAVNGAEAVEMVQALQPDVVLLDLDMPKKDGLTALREIRQMNPDLPMLILTGFGDDKRLIQAVKAGASGCLLKDSSPDSLVSAIQMVSQGKPYLDPSVALLMVNKLHEYSEGNMTALAPENILSSREIDVLKLLARGYSNQEIAKSLVISKRTVGTHVSTILNKLHLNNRTQAALYALKMNLVRLDSNLFTD